MDLPYAIQQFKALKHDINSWRASNAHYPHSPAPISDKMIQRYEILLENAYTPSNRNSTLMRTFYEIKIDEGYNENHRLQMLEDLIDNVIFDLQLKEQQGKNNYSSQIKDLEAQLQNYKQVEDHNQKTIAQLKGQLHERQEALTRKEAEMRFIERDGLIRASFQNSVTRLKRYLWIVSFALITILNFAIPFVLQKFNWLATGIVQVSILGVFLWMYYRPKVEISSSVKQNAIAFVLGILGTVIGGYILYRMGWNN